MRIAIFENIMTPGGHEVDFDRIIVEEMKALGHEVIFYVPEDFVFSFDYKVAVKWLQGKTVSYTNVSGLKKLLYSVKREINRQGWYKQLYKAASEGEFDALIVPTSTYRYLRALKRNVLKNSPVPVIFVLHGINPGEAPKFLSASASLLPHKGIKMIVLTFGDDIFGKKLSNIFPIYPPTFTARDIDFVSKIEKKEILKIGFFGQYRREKKLESFLEVFQRCNYTRPIELLVQGSTMHPEDAEDFERIIAKYKNDKRMSFLHKGLIGAEWQQAIADADVLLMPYSAPRYLYHWGAMLFTAIGFQKPVIASDDINPEVFEKFNIGKNFKSGDLLDLQRVMENFINNFDDNVPSYASGLEAAAKEFSPKIFAKKLLDVMR